MGPNWLFHMDTDSIILSNNLSPFVWIWCLSWLHLPKHALLFPLFIFHFDTWLDLHFLVLDLLVVDGVHFCCPFWLPIFLRNQCTLWCPLSIQMDMWFQSTADISKSSYPIFRRGCSCRLHVHIWQRHRCLENTRVPCLFLIPAVLCSPFIDLKICSALYFSQYELRGVSQTLFLTYCWW